MVKLMFEAVCTGIFRIIAAAQPEISAADHQRTAIHDGIGKFFSGGGIDLLDCGPGYLHKGAALLLGKAFLINKTDGFILIHRHPHRLLLCGFPFGYKGQSLGKMADFPEFSGSGHWPPSFLHRLGYL